MNKTIESLRRFPPKNDILHEHIANTYFSQKTRSKRKARVSHKKVKISFATIMILAAAVSAVLFLPILNNYYLGYLKNKLAGLREINIIERGHLNTLALKRFAFRGYAREKSRFSNECLILKNTKKYNWADASLDFKFPLDFSNRKLLLSLKGNIGGERLHIVLRDAHDRSARLDDIYLTPQWKTTALSLNPIKDDIDVTKIKHLRLECGSIGESGKELNSPIEVIIYVKDFAIIKEDRV